jgi:hypothetical protein
LFEIEIDAIVNTDGLKYASKSQTLIKELIVPEISLEQRIEFGIRVVKLVCKDTKWNNWADNWLDKSDRTRESAHVAYTYVANPAASAAAYAANAYAAYAAATTAAYAAWAADAADAAWAADAADAADAAAASAAYAADYNAYNAADAAYAAARAADAEVVYYEFNKQMIEIIESIIKKDFID